MQTLNETLDFSSLSSTEIEQLLRDHNLSLSVNEALTIQNDFLKRPPTLSECVLWSIQGSEHCSYKSSRIHLKQFNTNGPHVILGAKEDAGIVSVARDNQGHRYGIIVSHESHNHPSQIVPYEGAATGVGGNVRDVCCMGGEVIAVADSLRFGDIQRSHTHWIQEGVIAGIAGYGNPLGIPNIAGDVYYDSAYNENCLVTVVTLGVVREDHIIHSYAPPHADDYVYILVGKPTDNSGFGGASFASSNLEEDSKEKNKGAVQEPNAFLQRHLLKANYALFDYLRKNNLIDKVGFKDLGAGGVACASIELAEAGGSYGAEIDLEKVPTAIPDLLPSVILCSETQERFMWVVPPNLVETILSHYNERFALPQVSQGACAAVIGKVRTDGLYVAHYRGNELVRAKVPDVTKGIVYNRPFIAKQNSFKEPNISKPLDFNGLLLKLLAHENIASKEPVFETYDKQVQGRTTIEAGWADAGVMQPFNESKYPEEIRKVGIALSLDHNPRYNKIDAYWGAVNAVIEAVRNVVAVGADPIALTDCLCFGNPEKPEQMGEFVDSVKGIVDACKAIRLKEYPEATLPVIAGNVSLYNESAKGPIPPSPMISCLGKIPNIDYAISYDFKHTDSVILLIGERKDEFGGSVYYQLHGELGFNIPKPDLHSISNEIMSVSEVIQKGLVLAAHDVSEGGVAVAIAEMSFKHSIGAEITIPGHLSNEKLLFGESGGFILELSSKKLKQVQDILNKHKVSYQLIGQTTSEPVLKMNSVINTTIEKAQHAWTNGLRERLL
ncbi:phosphoribosylformylglycinamidine synthase subunit PurL [Legionella waltersii]|uniref:Phosphoribosylformylglycinamidine synthase subunit PurL n=1 Tax=Legionella waltersii TaxID=66969 RepID=A0A0W1A1Q7_9GAMM|nr:phosphoribosylformylglycinamidine synthase subunit PurL [Legionella waltersii]KTD75161.1 phosphoribosylformylglycinamidine synthase II (FGAM synthase II) [Legionella waltersii]SNV04742.1 phosphoribosylformylglycinamidine synthase [Legionella waltersii]